MSSKYPVLSEALTKRYALPEADADKFVAQMFDVLLKAVEPICRKRIFWKTMWIDGPMCMCCRWIDFH